jgi:hypothetical protein
LSGACRPGGASGVPHRGTLMCTDQSSRSSLRSARRPWLSCTGPIQIAGLTTTHASLAQGLSNAWQISSIKKSRLRWGLRPGGALYRSYDHLSRDMGRSNYGGRDLWAASSNPYL